MRTFGALVWREIFERRLLLLASAFLGLVPIVAPWLPGRPERFAPEDIRTVAVMVLAILFGGATVLILGSTIVGRDLSEGRLGFYFSRPISGWTLWLSRLAAACVLILASLLLIVTPAGLVDFESWTDRLFDERPGRALPILVPDQLFFDGHLMRTLPEAPSEATYPFFVFVGIVILLALAHVASTIVRDRSAWLLVDMAGLGAVAALTWAARNLLVKEQSLGALVWAEWSLVPWILLALVVAGGVQLTRGRTDLGRGHRYLSATLWLALIVGALVFGAYARWVVSSEVEDLESLRLAEASPDEQWLLAGGQLRRRAGAEAAFLVDTRSEHSWRLGSLAVVWGSRAFSADGGTVVWARCESYRPLDCEVWAKDLRDPESPPRRTGVAIDHPPNQVVLSGDGTRLALVDARQVAAYELSSARLLAAVEAVDPDAAVFLSRDLLRFHDPAESESGRTVRIRQLDLTTRKAVETGRLPRGYRSQRSASGDVLFHQRYFPPGLGLYDGETGRPLVDSTEPVSRVTGYGCPLADGRWVTSTQNDTELSLTIFSPQGQEQSLLQRPGVMHLRCGGELAPGRVLLALMERSREPRESAGPAPGVEPLPGWTTYTLDADTGELSPLAAGMVPLGAPPKPTATRIFLAGGLAVIRWNPATGQHHTLLPPFAKSKPYEPFFLF